MFGVRPFLSPLDLAFSPLRSFFHIQSSGSFSPFSRPHCAFLFANFSNDVITVTYWTKYRFYHAKLQVRTGHANVTNSLSMSFLDPFVTSSDRVGSHLPFLTYATYSPRRIVGPRVGVKGGR